MSRRRLIENIVSLGALQAASYLLPLLSLPYLARVLGPENLGRMAFAIAFAQIFVILTDYGFNLSAAREISIHRDNPLKVAEIFYSVLLLRFCFALLGFAMLAVLVNTLSSFRLDAPLYLVCYMLVVGNVIFPQWLFQGLEMMKTFSLMQFAARFCAVVGIFFFVKSKNDLLWAALLQSSGAALAGVLTMPLVAKAVNMAGPSGITRDILVERLREGWHVFVAAAAINVYTTGNSFVLGLLTNPLAVGYFHVAEKIVRAAQSVFGPVSQAVYPHISLLAQQNPVQALRFNRKLIIGLGLAGLAVSLFLHLASELLVRLLFGEAYRPAAGVLKILAFLPLIVILSNVLGIQTALAFGLRKSYSRVYLAAAPINLMLFIPLAGKMGAQGAALANVLVESFVTVAMFIFLHRHGKNPLTFEFPRFVRRLENRLAGAGALDETGPDRSAASHRSS